MSFIKKLVRLSQSDTFLNSIFLATVTLLGLLGLPINISLGYLFQPLINSEYYLLLMDVKLQQKRFIRLRFARTCFEIGTSSFKTRTVLLICRSVF
jgi:hypothetical protein